MKTKKDGTRQCNKLAASAEKLQKWARDTNAHLKGTPNSLDCRFQERQWFAGHMKGLLSGLNNAVKDSELA